MKPVPEGSCSIQQLNLIWKKPEHFVLLTDRVLIALTNALLEEILAFMTQLLNQTFNSSTQDLAGFIISVYDKTCMFSFEASMTDIKIIAPYSNYMALYGNYSVL